MFNFIKVFIIGNILCGIGVIEWLYEEGIFIGIDFFFMNKGCLFWESLFLFSLFVNIFNIVIYVGVLVFMVVRL